MSSERASAKKRAGHKLEENFAKLMNGEVNAGAQTDKKDVIDKQHRTHSVKGGTWWQIFLYSKFRLETNTIFQGIGNLAPLMIACIDAFPKERKEYLSDKHRYKTGLQQPMRALAKELQDDNIRQAFFSKALFNAGEVNYLSVWRRTNRSFNIFYSEDVVDILTAHLQITNSKARNVSQYDDQKVLFKLAKNAGEIEIRTDSDVHYRQIKCRFNAALITDLLIDNCERKELNKSLPVYGKAIKSFHLL